MPIFHYIILFVEQSRGDMVLCEVLKRIWNKFLGSHFDVLVDYYVYFVVLLLMLGKSYEIWNSEFRFWIDHKTEILIGTAK